MGFCILHANLGCEKPKNIMQTACFCKTNLSLLKQHGLNGINVYHLQVKLLHPKYHSFPTPYLDTF